MSSCKGITQKLKPCKITIGLKDGYCKHHINGTKTSTLFLRTPYLRNEKYNHVLTHLNFKDKYTNTQIHSLERYDLDHVVELQIIRDVLDEMRPSESFIEDIKKKANDLDNLNFTTTEINMGKCKATSAFLSDYKKDQVHRQGYFHYLRSSNLTRDQSFRISSAVKISFEAMTNAFELETPIVRSFDEEMNSIFLKLKL